MHKRNIDIILLISIILLSLIGLIMVYSASNVIAENDFNDEFYYFKRQLLFYIVGYICMVLLIEINLDRLLKNTTIIFGICILLLILVLIPGIGIIRGGARSWIGIGPFSLQPSEFMKFAVILLISKYLSNYYFELKNIKNFLLILMVIIVVFLLIMLQPDFGTGLVIILSCLVIVYISGAPFKYFVAIGILGIIGIVLLIISAPYRIERITAYLDPWNDPLGSGFQGIQSLFAITPGGLFGHGFNNSIQKHYFLPEPQNDFLFAILIEEFGLIGGVIVISLYFIIVYRGIKIGLNNNNNFYKFLSIGLSIALAVQVFINIGVVIGLLPVTGITLPIFSYGGSSLITTLCSLGIILNISRYRNYD